MRVRSAVGAGVLLVAVVAAVVLMRDHPAPTGQTQTPAVDTSVLPPAPAVVDARARQLTATFRSTTLLPPTVHFIDDPHTPPGFVFRRYADPQSGRNLARYTAEGSVARTSDNAVLDHILIMVWRTDGRAAVTSLARCGGSVQFGGMSCTQASFPNGALAKVVRNQVFAQTVASDSTTGSPPGLQTDLEEVYPDGTIMSVTLYSMNKAGIPLDDAAMLKLATISGVSAPR
ncbi:MAG TPA: hypothetical protein VGL06_06940 [Pseudonocardiaceae bacterium]|jgi:hypothetical protein